MIVWGGSWLTKLDTGAVYDPALNTWAPVSMSGVPAARSGHTAVWTGNEMIVWGGVGSSAYLNDGGHYNPATDTWTPTVLVGAPSSRFDHTAVWTGEEMVVWSGKYVAGSTDYYLADGGRYRCVP